MEKKDKQQEENEKMCFYCIHPELEVDYKDTDNLRKFISSYGKISPKRRSHLCSAHQRKVATAVKRARQMALLSYTSR